MSLMTSWAPLPGMLLVVWLLPVGMADGGTDTHIAAAARAATDRACHLSEDADHRNSCGTGGGGGHGQDTNTTSPLSAPFPLSGGADGLSEDDKWRCADESSPWSELRRAFLAASDNATIETADALSRLLLHVTADVHLPLIPTQCNVGVVAAYHLLGRMCLWFGDALRGYRLLQMAQVFVFTLRNKNKVPEIEGQRWGTSDEQIIADMQELRKHYAAWDMARRALLTPVPKDFRDPKLRIGIVSICAYTDEWALKYVTPHNRQIYASRHNYTYLVHDTHPMPNQNVHIQHAKLYLLAHHLRSGRYDWLMWLDCDSIIMDFNRTIDSIIHTYSQQRDEPSSGLDPNVGLLITEEGWGLSSANFLVRNSPWTISVLGRAFVMAHVHQPLFGDQDALIMTLINEAALTLSRAIRLSALIRRLISDAAPAPAIHSQEVGDEVVGATDAIDVRAVVIPQHEMNSYDVWNGMFLRSHAYEKGDFLITFPGCREPLSCNGLFVCAANYALDPSNFTYDQHDLNHLRVFGPPLKAFEAYTQLASRTQMA
ncbi:unnamed protein product [Vitrella brassicaformis CCMP3155]|uniref:Galactosyl transferase GMA12/MNN10 family protein n=1 Tax=Vitrella brassicaformis (strain CCMP3155) TaxID=1169540 RepID=A0A0G4GGZ8_VITBC|nr:unnamed protein product [Vitrella brassicaformis CCMP3155]|eukprot:CEM28910.1 unnamed protein product [Vitrella brassicaformis CCMP3155]